LIKRQNPLTGDFAGAKIAGDAREKLEKRTGKKVSSSKNYLRFPQDKKLLK